MAAAIPDRPKFISPPWSGSSPVSWGSPESPPRVVPDSQRGPGTSWEDAFILSSDDESGSDSEDAWEPVKPYGGNLGDGQSDVSVPPDEVASRDQSFSASFGTGGDGDAAETSTIHGRKLNNEFLAKERSPAFPVPPVSPERRPASAELLQLAQDLRSPVGKIDAPSSGCTPEAATCDDGVKGSSGALPARVTGTPSSGRISRLCSPGLEDHSGGGVIPCGRPVGDCQKASGNDSDGEAEAPKVKRTLSQRMAAARCRSRLASGTSSVNSNGEDQDGKKSNTRGNLSTGSGSRRHDHGGDDHPRDNESDQEADARPTKRRKRSFPTAVEQQTGCSDRRRQQVRKRNTSKKRQSQHVIPRPPSSPGASKEVKTVQTQFAGFEEWPLQNAVLKCATVNGETTFQLEFSRGRCAGHKRRNASPCRRRRKQPAQKRRSIGKSPASTVAAPTTPDEEEWEVRQILASRMHCEKLQYQVKWANWEDDQEWYDADGFKKSPHLLKLYHEDHPEMPGPPVQLEQWLLAYENDAEEGGHSDDNKH